MNLQKLAAEAVSLVSNNDVARKEMLKRHIILGAGMGNLAGLGYALGRPGVLRTGPNPLYGFAGAAVGAGIGALAGTVTVNKGNGKYMEDPATGDLYFK